MSKANSRMRKLETRHIETSALHVTVGCPLTSFSSLPITSFYISKIWRKCKCGDGRQTVTSAGIFFTPTNLAAVVWLTHSSWVMVVLTIPFPSLAG